MGRPGRLHERAWLRRRQHRALRPGVAAFAESGRLFFAASGNAFVLSLTGHLPPGPPVTGYDVPPWVVPVGGGLKRIDRAQPLDDCNLVSPYAGKPAEFVGDFTQRLPAVESVAGYREMSGTSFATPQVATRFARALVGVRERFGDTRARGALWAGPARPSRVLDDGRLTASELRDVLAGTAELFATTDANRRAYWRCPTGSTCRPARRRGWRWVGATSTPTARTSERLSSPAPPNSRTSRRRRRPSWTRSWPPARPCIRAPVDNGCNAVITPLDSPAGTFYVDVRRDSVWLYEETNGRPGLQSGGDDILGAPDADPCAHENPDRLIW